MRALLNGMGSTLWRNGEADLAIELIVAALQEVHGEAASGVEFASVAEEVHALSQASAQWRELEERVALLEGRAGSVRSNPDFMSAKEPHWRKWAPQVGDNVVPAVPRGSAVRVRFRNGGELEGPKEAFDWAHAGDDHPHDIVAYHLVERPSPPKPRVTEEELAHALLSEYRRGIALPAMGWADVPAPGKVAWVELAHKAMEVLGV